MKDELNTYGITNADGVAPPAENEGKVSYANDRPGYISEGVKVEEIEVTSVSETYDDQGGVPAEEGQSNGVDIDLSSASSTASTSAASASVGGGLGALAGVVATSVVAAVVVVAAFISTLAISLSLVMADMFSLTFEVTMTGADERDFEQPIYAILTGEDTHQEQQVTADTVLLTFDDLAPGKEYRLTIKNEEKVFAEVSAFTATEPNDKGDIVSRMDGTDVFVTVRKASLRSGEYYTLIAKDASGNVVFSKDGMDEGAEYAFTVDAPKDLYFFLVVKGKSYAVSQTQLPLYDFESGVWTWNDDHTAATVTFTDTRGGDDLTLEATVTRKRSEPTCEEDGATTYTARVTYEGKDYTDKKITVIDALGHHYEGTYEGRTFVYTCSRCGDTYTD